MAEVYLHANIFRGQPFARAVRKAKSFGYDGMEAWFSHFRDRNDPVGSLTELKRVTDSEGVRMPVAPLSADLLVDDVSVRQDNLSRTVDYIGEVGALGFEWMNGYIGWLNAPNGSWHESGSVMAAGAHHERAVEGCAAMAKAAEEAGITITLEIHMRTPHDSAASAMRILDAVDSPRMMANIDSGNLHGVNHAESPTEAVDILGKRLGYAHLKNCRRFGEQADYHYPLWGGDLDYAVIIRHMHEQGYTGPYCIEYSGDGDRSYRAREDLNYVREILTDLNAE